MRTSEFWEDKVEEETSVYGQEAITRAENRAEEHRVNNWKKYGGGRYSTLSMNNIIIK